MGFSKEEIQTIMKHFITNSGTSSVNKQLELLDSVTTLVKSSDCPPEAATVIIHSLASWLDRHQYASVCRSMSKLLHCLINTHPKTAVNAMCTCLRKIAEYQQKNVIPSRSESARSLIAFSWSCLVVEQYFLCDVTHPVGQKNQPWCNFAAIQVMLYNGACASMHRPIKKSAARKLHQLSKKIEGSAYDVYHDSLMNSTADQGVCGFLGALVSSDSAAFQKKKEDYLNSYVKLIVMSKTRPLPSLLNSCGPALKYTTHEDFNNILVPGMQKALLRNPEIVLPTICTILHEVAIDLSQHGMTVIKSLTSQLSSKTDICRDEAVLAMAEMASQCSDAGAVEDVVQYLFGVFKGSEGKLSLAGQKISVLDVIGKLSRCPVGGGQSSVKLSSTVVGLFVSLLQQETHEGTLVKALSSLSGWCRKFTSEVPSILIDLFKKGPGLKTSTSVVRASYVECMICTFTRDSLEQANVFLPSLLQTVEKASGQAMQIPIVCEALSAAYLICKLVTTETKIGEGKLNAFWTTVLDTKKKVFTSDKFLQQASDTALLRLISLSECLLLDHPSKAQDDKIIPYCSAVVHQLLSKSWEIRKTAQKTVRKLLSSLSGSHFCSSLISQFSAILQPSKVVDLEELDDPTEVLKSYIPPQRFENALNCFLHVPAIYSSSQTASSIALQLLPDCYHPCIRVINNHIWTDFLVNAKLDAVQYIEGNLEIIMAKYVKEIPHTESGLCALGDLVRIAPHVVMPAVMDYVTKELINPKLVQVTSTDYLIMNTPDGELWNKAVIESGPKIAENKNIKRENKLYSHKEQMEFLQLQKEIEAKKLSKGGGGGSKGLGGIPKEASQPLSKKQKELVEQELQKEAEIRKKLLMIKTKFQALCSVLESCMNQQSAFMLARYAPSLVELFLPLLSSLLTSKSAQNLFVLLRKTVVDDRMMNLDIQVAYATLRLRVVAHPIPANWCEEDLKSSAARIASSLRKILKTGAFTSPCFSYIFPFFSSLLRDGGARVNGDEEIMMQILECVNINVKAASQTGTEDDDGPKFLPRQRLLESMRQLIGTSTYKIQNIACQVFIATCKSAASMNPDLPEVAAEVEVLLQCLLSPLEFLRRTTLKGMIALVDYLSSSDVTPKRLWVAKFDSDEECKTTADELWIALRLSTDTKLCQFLLEDVTHHEPVVQKAAALALHAALEENQDSTAAVLHILVKTYNEKLQQPPAVLDSLGRVLTESPPDDFQSRAGIAMALLQISPVLDEDQIKPLFSFFVPDALKDRSPEVRSKMLSAALQAVNDHGKSCTSTLLGVFENFLKQAPNSESFDTVRQSVVILMGTLARHLEKNDPKVKPIVAKLTETLSTPSQPVQEAIANCLPPLVPAIKADAPDIVKKMLLILLESENYGERKGAAYGLAGMVKGLGIIAFKQLDIMNTLTEAIQDKKNFRHREGALFAFEMFCTMLGRLFEPYIVHVLPHLLVCFGDGNQYVREAADDTARAVMKNLSAHGVKLVLPSLVSALQEDSWRTKTGSVELLGAMAYCAPKQLSSCLPSVVPRLCDVMTDSHPKVQKAGQQALKQIGSVIRNPEIQAITPILLDALSDPSRKTSKCLQTLLNTKFVHFIDAASLALIMPVVHRAFQDRSTDTRKMAAQIIGNMYSLTDQKDLNPYLSSLIPGLKTTLLDPVPEVRTVASKALGAMVRVTGESLFEQLLPWLMDTLTSEQSSVDRSGAAQGLSEILSSLGVGKLDKLLPDIIRMASSQNVLPHVRDGYIMMYIYLPTTFGDSFSPYIGDIIPALLKALADEVEFLRETALTAGQRIITMYAETAITLLLPQLESGLFDENWRIRLSSVQLLGDLLYHVSGVTGKMSASGEEDDNFGTSAGHQTIMDVLGETRRNRVFSGLYMGRSDVALLVRQSALHVWKIVVPNTPRVLREILPTLFQLLLGCLASSSYDKRQVAARTLGDIVRKLGERMLPEIIPILEKGLESEQADQRQGVCIGLSEIIKSCSRDAILTFTDNLVPTVRRALEDPLPEVREAAALTFENLHNTIGLQALEGILPSLMKDLDDSSKSEYVVDGLKHVIAVKGRVVMPFIVPKLIQSPVNTRVIAFLSSVAGEALTKHLSSILKALVSALVASSSDEDVYSSTLEDCKSVVLSVEGDHGMRIVLDDLMEATRSENVGTRKSAISLLHTYCQNTESDFSDYVAVFIRGFFKLLVDSDERIQEEAWMALSAVTKKLDAAEQLQHVSSIRQAIRFIRDDVKECGGILPGFCLPKKGLTPVLPIFREGILNGSPDMKEQAAKGLSECIQIMTPLALKPSVVNITGPLIRILGDRFSSNVRIAVLETLTFLLEKAGVFLKPFLPQLQTTFSKALHDSSRAVRLQSAAALKHLVTVHPRLDPLFTDLNNNIKSSEDPLVKETLLHALRGCIIGGGSKMNSSLRNDIISTLSSALYSDEESCCRCAAGCLGSLCSIMPDTDLENFLTHTVLVQEPDASWSLRQGRSAVLAVSLKEAADRVYSGREETILNAVSDLTSLDRVQIVINGVHAAAYLLRYHIKNNTDLPNKVIDSLQKGFTHTSNDIKTETCNSVNWAVSAKDSFNEGEENGHQGSSLSQKTQIKFTSILISLTKEKNTTVRCSAESCLVTLLSLRQSDEFITVLLPQLSNRDSNSLMELQKTRFKKLLLTNDVIGDIDDTLLTK